jgi:hypothetical protein
VRLLEYPLEPLFDIQVPLRVVEMQVIVAMAAKVDDVSVFG